MKQSSQNGAPPPIIQNNRQTPLADRMRPSDISHIIGQEHLLAPGKPLRAYFEQKCPVSAIFYGPPGTGKTTVAKLIAKAVDKPFLTLNATLANTADMKKIFELAEEAHGILLYLDEIQYFNKKQQQTMLSFVESGNIQLIGATTENPYFYIYKALLSRCMVFEFKPVPAQDIAKALTQIPNLSAIKIEPSIEAVCERIAQLSSGDVRKAFTITEMLINTATADTSGRPCITLETLASVMGNAVMRYDRGGDEMYDLASGLHKSMRGSDPDAALHYLSRFLEAGDIMTPIRRILCAASEDVGLAYSQCALIAKTLCDSALQLGLPEAQLPLAHAVLMICSAPKSNSVHEAIKNAWSDVKNGAVYPPPRNLQNVHADTTGTAPCCAKKAQNYLYPHDYPNHWVDQPYMPKEIENKKYYQYGENPAEQNMKNYWQKVKNRML